MTNDEIDKLARDMPGLTLHGHIPVETTMALARRVVELLSERDELAERQDPITYAFDECSKLIDGDDGWQYPAQMIRTVKSVIEERDKAEARVAEAEDGLRLECPCCGQAAAEWFVTDGDSLLCGCDGTISCCSESYPYANVDGCECGGNGYPK